MSNPSTEENILDIRRLRIHYPISSSLFNIKRDVIKAVDDVTFKVKRGSTVGLVGESGSGKTTIGRSIIKLAPISAGEIYYNGTLISNMKRKEFFPYRKKIQMIFQDPFNSLNPRMKIGDIIEEPLKIHFPKMDRNARHKKVRELLDRVQLKESFAFRYPHEFSGGQRQRIGIARALAVEPEFIICDEPVSALDVSVQAQIINLLEDLQDDLGLTYLFIAHDLAVVEHISDYVLVMTSGKIVEQANANKIYHNPQHIYTKKLLGAVPIL